MAKRPAGRRESWCNGLGVPTATPVLHTPFTTPGCTRSQAAGQSKQGMNARGRESACAIEEDGEKGGRVSQQFS